MPSRRLHPDTALQTSLQAGAHRRLQEGLPFAEVVVELRAEAAGRADLLGQAAGSLIGLYLARPDATQPQVTAAFAALVMAGADTETLVASADEVRGRMSIAP